MRRECSFCPCCAPWLVLDEVGLRFAAFGFSRNKNNASTNQYDAIRLVEIRDPSYAKTIWSRSFEFSRRKLMPTGIPSPGLATAVGLLVAPPCFDWSFCNYGLGPAYP